MKVRELIRILGQFDGDRRVVIQAARYLLKPCNIHPLTQGEHLDNATPAEFGDIIIEGISE